MHSLDIFEDVQVLLLSTETYGIISAQGLFGDELEFNPLYVAIKGILISI